MSKRHSDEKEEETPKHEHKHGEPEKPYVGDTTPPPQEPPTDDPPPR